MDRWETEKFTWYVAILKEIVPPFEIWYRSSTLADMLMALYCIDVKTCCCYIKVFWHFVDVAIVNVWTLYKRHKQLGLPTNKRKQQNLHLVLQLRWYLQGSKSPALWKGNSNEPPQNQHERAERKQLYRSQSTTLNMMK